jgi:hypothetical protein
MYDDLRELERVLRDRAAEVPHIQMAPPKMLARARRRVVRNGLVTVVAVAVIVVGASAGLASLGALRGSNQGPATNPSTPVPAISPCTAGDLRATAALGGAAGSVEGSIRLTNFSSKTCTLNGRPTLQVLSSATHPLQVQVIDVAPQWQADKSPAPHGWPVVRLRPGGVAAIRVSWSNECPQLTAPALWKVNLGNGKGTLDVFGADGASPPPCNGPGEPSTLQVGPFEPGTE